MRAIWTSSPNVQGHFVASIRTVWVILWVIIASPAWGVTVDTDKRLSWSGWTSEPTSGTCDYYIAADALATCPHLTDAPPFVFKLGKWQIPNGLPLQTVEVTATGAHGTSSLARTTVAVTKPTKRSNGRWGIDATITAHANCQAIAGPPPPCDAFSTFTSDGAVKIPGQNTKGLALTATFHDLTIDQHCFEHVTVRRTPSTNALNDPVQIILTDIDTGTVTTETLFAWTVEAGGSDGDCSWQLSSTDGIQLAATGDASVVIDGAADSDWLVNPFGQFGASLANGVFNATGVWASAPWVLTYAGSDVVAVSLDAAYVPTDLGYIIPSALLSDTHDYQQELSIGNGISGEDTDHLIPEPNCGLLLLVVAALLLGRSLRHTPV